MLKNSENNGTEEIGLITPTPALPWCPSYTTEYASYIYKHLPGDPYWGGGGCATG